MYRVVQKKTAQSLMHSHYATVCSRITRFSRKCSVIRIRNKFWILWLSILCLAAAKGTT